MTPRFSATQNKTRLIAGFLFTVLLALVFYVAREHFAEPALAGGARVSNEAMFIGLRKASPAEIRQALPQAAGKPLLLFFSSKLCHDCKRMAPVLSELMPKHSGVYYRKIDVLVDRDKAPAVFRAFKPVSVPMLVFIDQKGQIVNVLYNYQSPQTVTTALGQLEQQS